MREEKKTKNISVWFLQWYKCQHAVKYEWWFTTQEIYSGFNSFLIRTPAPAFMYTVKKKKKKRTKTAIRLCRWGRETTNKLTDSGSYPLLSCARIWRVNLQHKNEPDPRMAAHQIFFLPRMHQTSALSMATVSVACLAAARRAAPTKWQINNVDSITLLLRCFSVPSLSFSVYVCVFFFLFFPSLSTKICQLQINLN